MAEPEATVDDAALNVVPSPTGHDVFGLDAALVEAVARHGAGDQVGRLRELGRLAGSPRCARWVQFVDRHPPRLRACDPQGRRTDEIDFHPAWHRLLQSAVRAGLSAAAWDDAAPPAAHAARAAALVVWAQTEIGHLTALSTTYAAVPALRTDDELADTWVPRLASRGYESALRPPQDKLGCLAGMAVTERGAGGDLRATATVARPERGGPLEGGATYRLRGRKWFCSAPTSDVFLVLAQAPGGLTCFVVPRVLPDGTRNPWHLLRLEDTLGVRSAAHAEIELDGTWAARLGDEGRGLRVLLGTSSANRLDGVLGSAGTMRYAVTRAIHHARHRRAYGSALADKALMQNVLADLAIESEASTVLAMRLAAAADAGERDLLRAGVPVAAYWVCRRAPQLSAEAMECLGGYGFVEDDGLARTFRDAPAASLQAGTGNVAALDVVRTTALQPRAVEALLAEVDRGRGADPRLDRAMDDVAEHLWSAAREARRDPDRVDGGARRLVERLAVVLQGSLLVRSAPAAVAAAFLATRVAGGGGVTYGTLPVSRQTARAVVDRALPA